MIIPQIAENLTLSDNINIPTLCPACGNKTVLRQVNEVESLYCPNTECSAKKIKSFTHFVSRDALNIEGLSEATLEKFIARGFLKEFTDIFHIDDHRQEIEKMEGFGEKSFLKLSKSIMNYLQLKQNIILQLSIHGKLKILIFFLILSMNSEFIQDSMLLQKKNVFCISFVKKNLSVL
jgi:NAD-dependent DNA ligase